MKKNDFKKSSGTRFSNVLYELFSSEYDIWVSNYKIENILYYLNGILQPNSNILECGAGTGLFSVFLLKYANSLTCVDLYEGQIEILRSKIEGLEKGEAVNFIVDDAKEYLNTEKIYDYIFFGFSLDNILRYDPYVDNDLSQLEILLQKINKSLSSRGKCILIDSLPEPQIENTKREKYMDFRKKQIEMFSKQSNFIYNEFEFKVMFEDRAEAIENVSLIVGEKRAPEIFKSSSLTLYSHVSVFEKQK